ncbi:MAG: hypothetical protein F4X22_05690 [Gemmatimonadales bacterium]|nr:hypothetical protein [Candidatus Palauibacter denitrificans]
MGADVVAASLPLPQEPVLELEEKRTHRIPPGVTVGGATLSEDGDRLLAWAADAPTVLLYDGSGSEPRTLTTSSRVVGGRFLFLAAADADALVQFRDPPHTIWRIAVNGEVVASMQPDHQPTGGEGHEPPPNWLALSAPYPGSGVIQVIADVTTDRRLLVIYDAGGDVLSHRLVSAPFGFVATASQASMIVALRTFEDSELSVYSWRWRTTNSTTF